MKQPTEEYTIIDHLLNCNAFSHNDTTLKQILEYLEINPKVLKTRERPMVMVRMYLAFIIHVKLNRTSAETGRILGGRDHATMLHAISKHRTSLETNDNLYFDIIKKVDRDLKKLEIKHVLTID